MLDEYKSIYVQRANMIDNWESIDKNELCNLYINCTDESLKESYLAAIICNYWGLLTKYYGLSFNVASREDVYEWLIDSIDYALKHKSWTKPTSSIYMDKNGPDKVINRCMKCRRLTYYQSLNRKKRKAGVMKLSLDQIHEDTNDCNDYIEDLTTYSDTYDSILKDYINRAFNAGDYFLPFLLDCIAYYDVFKINQDTGKKEFNSKKLIKLMGKFNDYYFKEFSYKYDIAFDEVKKQWMINFAGLAEESMQNKIDNYLSQLKYSSFFSDRNHNIWENK